MGLHDAADDVALLADVLAERLLVLGVAQPLHDDLLGGAGRDPAEVGGGVVPLVHDLAVRTQLLGQHGDLAALAVDLHADVLGGALGVPVGGDQRGLDRLQHGVGRDALLALDRLEGGHVDVHCLSWSRAASAAPSCSGSCPSSCSSSCPSSSSSTSSAVSGVVAVVGALVHQVLVAVAGRSVELHLHPALAELGPGQRAGAGGLADLALLGPALLDREHHAVGVVDRDHPAQHLGAADGGGDQPADVAPPVPGQGQRAVHAGAGDLQDVGRAAQVVVLGVEDVGQRPADLGDVVQAHPAVPVHDHPHHRAVAGSPDVEVLEVVARCGDHRGEPAGQPLGGDGTGTGTGRRGHRGLLGWAGSAPERDPGGPGTGTGRGDGRG